MAALKLYYENVMITGVTFSYTPEGIPFGLCKAKKLIYVATAGGPVQEPNLGFAYVKALAESFFEIREISYFCAENLDIAGADVEGILARTIAEIDRSMA